MLASLYALVLSFCMFIVPSLVTKYSNHKTNFVLMNPPVEIGICSQVEDLFPLSKALMDPNPPQKGQNLTITLLGDLQKPLLPDSYLRVLLVKGSLKFPRIQLSVCDYIEGGCPVRSSPLTTMNLHFTIPSMVPAGEYEIHAELYGKVPETGYFHKLPSWITLAKAEDEYKRFTCIEGTLAM